MSFAEKLLRSKLVIWVLLVLPFGWAVAPIFWPSPSEADPLKSTLLHLGLIASILLAVVLTFSPLRVLFPKWGVALALNRHRRLVGVSAFVYASLHFTAHVLHVYDGTLATFQKEITKPFQLTGLLALAILLVLAITSLDVAIRRLGKRWKTLHRLVYLAAGLVIYHQAEARKIFPMQVVYIFGPLLALELARVWKLRANRRAASARGAATASPPRGIAPPHTS